MKRYKELRYGDKSYTETYKIDEILIKEGFDWFLDCEVENCRIEILKNTLVFNSGVFFNGTWQYGVFRDGQWKYGTWEGGVWYNGTWYNGIFKNGIIFGGRFIKGKIEGGEIRGGELFDVEISEEVVNNTVQKIEKKQKPQSGEPQNRGVEQKVQGQVQQTQEPEQVEQPGIQPEKIEERVKRFETFMNEGLKKNDIKRLVLYLVKMFESEFNLKKSIEVIPGQNAPNYWFAEAPKPDELMFMMSYSTRRPTFHFTFVDDGYLDILDLLENVPGLEYHYHEQNDTHNYTVTDDVEDIIMNLEYDK